MLFLLFHVGMDRFALETSCVVEVLPLVNWKHVPEPPPGVVGLMNYHRTPVPVVDVSMRMLGRPASVHMNTRIFLLETGEKTASESGVADAQAGSGLVALVAERVVGVARYAPSEFVAPDDMVATVPYLGPVLTDKQGVIQRIEIEHLLPPHARRYVTEQCTVEM